MKFFIDAWSAKFQSDKYPLEFYLYNIKELRKAKSPEKVGEHIINLLHWKDGKVRIDVLTGSEKYTLLPTKPNTYHEAKHKDILCSPEFYHWVKEVISLESFDADKVKDLATTFHLYGKDTVVIPTFILHILSPMIFPLYDQHVERAKRALLAQTIQFQSSEVNFSSYKEYQTFFHEILGNYPTPSLEDVKKVDSALWSFGKALKNQNATKPLKLKRKNYSNNKTTYVPNDKFKLEVLRRIDQGDGSQRMVMEMVSIEFGVTLSPSYYEYPGSHIYRWRRQLETAALSE